MSRAAPAVAHELSGVHPEDEGQQDQDQAPAAAHDGPMMKSLKNPTSIRILGSACSLGGASARTPRSMSKPGPALPLESAARSIRMSAGSV